MILLLRKRSLAFMFTGLFFLGLSFGTYKITMHPEMNNWVEQKIVITRVQTDQKAVGLTFDDGPDPTNTTAILDTLQKHHAKATFFVLGAKSEEHPQLLQRMVKEGHEVGNHSFRHADYSQKSSDFLKDDITRTNHTILQITSTKPAFVRPPGGFLSYDLVDIVKKESQRIAYWSYETDCRDWMNGKTASSIANHIVQNIQPGQIIILHDGCPNSMQTASAVSMILDQLTEDGYQFLTMTELLKLEKAE
ncbi:MAG: polysaccharide deacetylase family protein [Bacillota bacterium]|nr:polysaccharide deacetylase family protein [Bacillota bacterium]